MYYTYVLRSEKDKRRYIGSTEDVTRRLESHNLGLVDVTKYRRPFILVCYKKFDTRAEAMRFEKYLKSLKGGKTFQKIIEELTPM